MAHHLAEVLLAVETADGPERKLAQNTAVELILKLWSQRFELPGHVHPLKQLEQVIVVLNRLNSGAWPYRQRSKDTIDTFLADAFDGLRVLIAHGALLVSASPASRVELGPTEKFLDPEEKSVIHGLNDWIDSFESRRRALTRVLVVSHQEDGEDAILAKELEEFTSLDPKIRSRKILARQMGELISTLEVLKAELEKEEKSATAP
jgi:hypothetical protein